MSLSVVDSVRLLVGPSKFSDFMSSDLWTFVKFFEVLNVPPQNKRPLPRYCLTVFIEFNTLRRVGDSAATATSCLKAK